MPYTYAHFTDERMEEQRGQEMTYLGEATWLATYVTH